MSWSQFLTTLIPSFVLLGTTIYMMRLYSERKDPLLLKPAIRFFLQLQIPWFACIVAQLFLSIKRDAFDHHQTAYPPPSLRVVLAAFSLALFCASVGFFSRLLYRVRKRRLARQS